MTLGLRAALVESTGMMNETRRILSGEDGPAAGTRAGQGAEDEDVAERDGSVSRLGLFGLAGLTVREVERRLIFDPLERTNNNRTQAARLLGISIRTLRNKLAGYRRRGELEGGFEPGR